MRKMVNDMTEEKFQKKMEKIQRKNKEIELKNKLKEEKKKYRFSFSKIKVSNRVLIASILAIVLFTATCLFVQYKTGYEVNDTLATLWFGFWTVEIAVLAGIKISKVRKKVE